MTPNLTIDTEKCTICGQDVDYIQHIRVQHQVDENVAAALRALQRRVQQLEEKVDTLHAHEQD
jgi:hypothetical protein